MKWRKSAFHQKDWNHLPNRLRQGWRTQTCIAHVGVSIHNAMGVTSVVCHGLCHACIMQDPDIIQDVRIVKAKDRTYIQGVWGNPKEKHLVVEISEKQSPKHRDLIDIIAKKKSGGG